MCFINWSRKHHKVMHDSCHIFFTYIFRYLITAHSFAYNTWISYSHIYIHLWEMNFPTLLECSSAHFFDSVFLFIYTFCYLRFHVKMPEYEYIYGCDIYIQSAEWCSRDFYNVSVNTYICLLRKITLIPITTQQTHTVTIKTSQSAADFPAYKDEPFIYLNKQHSSLSWYSSRKKPQL